MSTNPHYALGMLLVIRICDGFEEVVVAERAADILRWAASGGVDEARIGDARMASVMRSMRTERSQPSPKS